MKKIAIVTGASSGMGKDFVLELLKEENIDEIWMVARRIQRLEKIASKEADRLKCFGLDLTELSSFEELEKLLSKQNIQILYLVNAAGAGTSGTIEQIEAGIQQRMIDLNVRALTLMTKICLPYMARNSHIIQLCSSSAFLPQPGFAAYAASKSYVLSFSRALRQEVKTRGIGVTIVCPGPVDTEFFRASGEEIHPKKKKFLAESRTVVKQAMKDAKRQKELSIYGTGMKFIHFAAKVIPTKLLLLISDRVLKR